MEIPSFASHHGNSCSSVTGESGKGVKVVTAQAAPWEVRSGGGNKDTFQWEFVKESFFSNEALSSSWRHLLAGSRWQQLRDTPGTWLRDSNFLNHCTDLCPCPTPEYIRINDSPGKKKGFLKTGDVTAKDMLAYVRNCGELATDRPFLRKHRRIFRNKAYLETFHFL